MPARRRTSSRKRSYRRSSTLSDGRRYGPRQVRRATRRVRRALRSRQPECSCPSELSPGAKFALAQIDPFHVSSHGAKIPDSNTQPSIANTDCEQVTLTSSAVAADLNGIAFRPFYTWGTVTATPGAALNWGVAYATNIANRSKNAAYSVAMELSRPVAHAIRISSPVAPTAATGFVHIGISTESIFGGVTWQYPTTIAQISGLQFYKRVTLASLTQSPVTVINKWIDDTAFRYSAPNGTTVTGTGSSFQTDYAWGTLVIICEGCPVSSAIVSAEHMLLSEAIPSKDAVIVGTTAAPNNPDILSATSSMQSNTEGIHTENEQDNHFRESLGELKKSATEQGLHALRSLGPVVTKLAMSSATDYVNRAFGIGGVNDNPNRIAS